MVKKQTIIHKPRNGQEFRQLHNTLTKKGFVAIDALRPGRIREISLAMADAANAGAQDMATCMGTGSWSNGPLTKVAWAFDGRTDTVVPVQGKDGKPLGNGYVKWGSSDSIPSVIPPLAMSSPYTASPLRYLADLMTGLGPRLMYIFDDDTMCEYRKAGYRILERIEILKKNGQEPTYGGELALEPLTGNIIPVSNLESESLPAPVMRGLGIDFWEEAYHEWQRTWEGYDEEDDDGAMTHVPGAKEFLEENNLDLHMAQCMQDNVMLDIYFPAVGLQRGRNKRWNNPKIVRVGFFPASIVRMEKKDQFFYSCHCYVSDQWRTRGAGTSTTVGVDNQQVVMYPAAQPQNMLAKLRDIVEKNQRTRVNARPTWVICPTYYPSGNKPYYPQPAWWSIFTSKAFDFSATILYDKYKERDNSTSFKKILYLSLDYLNECFGDLGISGDKEAQQKFIDELDESVDQFLQRRENHGKTMRQWMWLGQDGKEHHNVEIVDVSDTKSDAVKAGKEELELSTSPIFLALGVDPRLVGVPMVAASNGGTALREMHLLKQQQLSVHKRSYEHFLNSVVAFNQWDPHATFKVLDQTLTTLDNSKTGTVETVDGSEV